MPINSSAWGIDFGTTNSALFAYLKHFGVEYSQQPFRDENGRPVLSAVAINKKTGETNVGYEAKRRHFDSPTVYEYIHSIKSVLEDDSWRKQIAGKIWCPIDVASAVFAKLKSQAEKLSYKIDDLVVAVPNGSSGKKRNRIFEAARNAGLQIRQFVTEPIAAFFANYNRLNSARYVAVFDWGGGTLDVTVLENRSDGKIVELASRGLQLAGDDIDEAIARDIHRRLCDFGKLKSIRYEEVSLSAREMLREECERAKCSIGDGDGEMISVMNYDGIVINENLSRETFSTIIDPYVSRALAVLSQAIVDAKLQKESIDKVLVVGGSSNLEVLQKRIFEMFGGDGNKVLFPADADWNVAKGAARLSLRHGEHYSAEDVGVILGDENGTFYPLLNGYFSTSPHSLSKFRIVSGFGIMDTTQYPRVVFAARDAEGCVRILDNTLIARAYGFLSEKIVLESLVDESLVLSMRVKSDHVAYRDALYWEYPGLRLVYETPFNG